MFITGIGSSGTVSGWSEGAGGFDWGGLVKSGLGLFSSFLQAKTQRKAQDRALADAQSWADAQARYAARKAESDARLAESVKLYALAESRVAQKAPAPQTVVVPAAGGNEQTTLIALAILGAVVLARKK